MMNIIDNVLEERLEGQIESALSRFRETQDLRDRRKLEDLRRNLSKRLSRGAKDCRVCGNSPHGMKHPGKHEVGCLHCMNRRAVGKTAKEAVENWNAEKFIT